MSEVGRFLSEHPLAAIAVCFVVLLFLFFCCKKLIKLALLALIVALAIAGYYYFQYPAERPAAVEEAVEKARTGTAEKGREVVKKGKGAVEKGKAEVAEKSESVIDKGREMAKTGKSLLDRTVERGRKFVDKVKRAAREVAKIFREEDKGDKR